MHINVTRHGPYVVVDIKANAFVHHMVRNITAASDGSRSPQPAGELIAELLAAKRQNAGGKATAKAEGLYLVAVDTLTDMIFQNRQWPAISGGLTRIMLEHFRL